MSQSPSVELPLDLQLESYPEGLHNVMRVSDRIYSGSGPEGERGFESLRQLGVKTVVSVDGATPNIELASKHGLRYVHIPIGYDGISREAGEMLARLVSDAEGPYYIHCHHGMHRGPAAAAVACIASGEIEAKGALKILERAGTSRDYGGLWRDVENYKPPPPDAELPELVEVAEISSFAAAMVLIDGSCDKLKLCRDVDWGTPPDHPDMVPSQEALLLQERLHEAGRHLENHFDEQFTSWLAEAEDEAVGLLTALKASKVKAADERFASLEQLCNQCHGQYRDQ